MSGNRFAESIEPFRRAMIRITGEYLIVSKAYCFVWYQSQRTLRDCAVPHCQMKRIESDPVRELRERLDIPNAEVGVAARRKNAVRVTLAERLSGVPRYTGQRLRRSQAERGAGHVHREQDGCHGRGSGV